MKHPAPALPSIETWQSRATAPALLPGQLHLWRIDAGREATAAALMPILAPEERQRADQFRLQSHRHRYLVTQSGLRTILASYLGADPAHLPVARGPHGKPYLQGQSTPLQFNLTTSDDLALLAITLDQEIGIDCEQVRPRVRLEALAAKMLLPEECAPLQGLPEEEQLLRFHQAWTRLEAQVKATGLGLYWGRPLSRARIAHTQGFIPAEGFIATLAAATPLPHPAEWLTFRWSQPRGDTPALQAL